MPEKATQQRVEKDRREGKAPSTQAGEFVREEIEHVREGKHGARSSRQAVAIGLAAPGSSCRRREKERFHAAPAGRRSATRGPVPAPSRAGGHARRFAR